MPEGTANITRKIVAFLKAKDERIVFMMPGLSRRTINVLETFTHV